MLCNNFLSSIIKGKSVLLEKKKEVFSVKISRCANFVDSDGRHLLFAIKKGSANTLLWKVTVRIYTLKVIVRLQMYYGVVIVHQKFLYSSNNLNIIILINSSPSSMLRVPRMSLRINLFSLC